MSPVEIKKTPCRPVEFKGQGTFFHLQPFSLGLVRGMTDWLSVLCGGVDWCRVYNKVPAD